MSTFVHPERQSLPKVLASLVDRVRRLEAVPQTAHYPCKLFADANALNGSLSPLARIVVAGDGKFIFGIPPGLEGASLTAAFAYVTTVGSSAIEVMVRNVTSGHDMLVDPLHIDTGEFTTLTSSAPYSISPLWHQVSGGDLISLDVDLAGGGDAEGLGVEVEFTK